MSEEIERTKIGIRLGEKEYPDGTIERRIDILTDDDLLKLLAGVGIVILFGVVITAILSK